MFEQTKPLNNLSIFDVAVSASRGGRNPQSDAPMKIAASKTPRFEVRKGFGKRYEQIVLRFII